MTQEEQTLLVIKGAIASLGAAEEEACKELADHIERVVKQAGEPVGTLAMALVGAKMQVINQS